MYKLHNSILKDSMAEMVILIGLLDYKRMVLLEPLEHALEVYTALPSLCAEEGPSFVSQLAPCTDTALSSLKTAVIFSVCRGFLGKRP